VLRKEEAMKDYLKLIVAGIAFSAIVIAAARDPTAREVNADQVMSRIEAAGYTDVENVRREANHWDAKATDKDGKQVSVDVDPKTGTVTPEDEKSGGRQLAFGYR
jgi:hypothetical protein